MGRCQGDDGFPPPVFTGAGSSWARRGDGSPHARGHGEGGMTCGCGKGGWVPAYPRLGKDGGWILAYARTRGGGNDMWVEERGMGPRPPSSRGQDLDARTRGGGNDMWVGKEGWVPACARTRGWVPAYARTRGWVPAPRLWVAGMGDGSPHARGHGEGE